MHNEWIKFLQSQQANIDEQDQLHFAKHTDEAQAAKKSSVIADLSPLGIIRVTGEDAADFLQGQFSNDIKQIDAKTAQLSSYCNPKGRVLAGFWLFRNNDNFYMLLPADTLAATLKRLRMFVMMSKVNLDDVSNEFVCIGLSGNMAEQTLQQQLGSIPVEANEIIHHGETSAIRLPGERSRYLVIGMRAEIQQLWLASVEQNTPIGYLAWKLLDIEVGLPSVYVDNVEAFVPQMLNLHAIGAVSFKKGCYPGQEIVARMHYLGKLKRRMYRAQVNTDTLPKVGDDVFTSNNTSGQGTGRIVMASPTASGDIEVLVVVQIKSAEQNDVHLTSASGAKLKFIDLPYQVSLEREN